MENAKDIIDAVKSTVQEVSATVRFVGKYGGEVFCTDPDSDKIFVGGVFENKAHVSLEFSEGASFDDPAGHLEGQGKNRRHLKLTSLNDVTSKDAKAFLEQAFANRP